MFNNEYKKQVWLFLLEKQTSQDSNDDQNCFFFR